MDDVLAQVEQLHIIVKKKDDDLGAYKNMVEKLQLMYNQQQAKINTLEATIEELNSWRKNEKSALQSKLDKVTSQAHTQEWVVSLNKLKKNTQFSKQFYFASTPFCFQLSAGVQNHKSTVWIHRCRGKNDSKTGRISSSLFNFNITVYVIGPAGQSRCRNCSLKGDVFKFMDLEPGSNRSVGYAFPMFFTSAVKWDEWLINNNLHFYMRIEPICVTASF